MTALWVRALALGLAAATAAACSPGSSEPPSSTPSDSLPNPWSSPGADPVLALVGATETVWDWTTQRCADEDIPDLPVRAFRDADGRVNLLGTHYVNYRSVGQSLDDVERDCTIIMDSSREPDPSRYQDRTWIASPYTEDGRTVHALAHNEYHGWEHPGQCSASDTFACWYNTITAAVSTDGGASYAPVGAPPAHLVAALPQRYEDGAGPYGFLEPSNIVKGPDGAYYSLVRVDEYRSEDQRICLLRTTDLASPSSWRAWGGIAFDVAFVDPYGAGGEVGRSCAAIDPGHLGTVGSSITFNTYLDRYVAVGTSADSIGGRETWGIYYSMSEDLIDWTPRKLLVEVELGWTWQPGDGNSYAYPSLLDPTSTSRNFETTGKTAYLYLTRFNGGPPAGLDRDLVRLPVEFFATSDEASAATVDFVP